MFTMLTQTPPATEMFKLQFLLFCLLFCINCSNSHLILTKEKPFKLIPFNSRWFGSGSSKIVPITQDVNKPVDDPYSNDLTVKPSINVSLAIKPPISPSLNNYFSLLPEEIVQEIFEFLINDYTFVRSASLEFRRIYDNLIYKVSWNNFPGRIDRSLRYKLIPLANLLYLSIKPIYKFKVDEHFELDRSALKLIKYMRIINIIECLKLTNILLKLKFINWLDVYDLLFLNYSHAVKISWSLGLTTIAREMYLNNSSLMISSLESASGGILIPIIENHYSLAHFMIISMRSHFRLLTKTNKEYLNCIIEELIYAKIWDLLREVYRIHTNHDYSQHLLSIAKQGSIEGLRALREYATNQCSGLAFIAASNGRLEFLKELYALGVLNLNIKIKIKRGTSAIHMAASHGHTGCLEFLVKQLGIESLSLEDDVGLLPIHLAARSGNPDTLLTVIKYYPYYRKPKFTWYWHRRTTTPLHLAVVKGSLLNTKILLDRFPELIDIKDEKGNTAIHLAVSIRDSGMLDLLLDVAGPETISASNISGDTALHLAARCTRPEIINLLMLTGHFTAMERNRLGRTPVFIYKHCRYSVQARELMQVFGIKSESLLFEALKTNKHG